MASPTASTPPHTWQAIQSDATWLFDAAACVQAALTSSGSLQILAQPSLKAIQTSIQAKEIFVLIGRQIEKPIGAVTICPFKPEANHGSQDWRISSSAKNWFLHSFFLEPSHQGQGLGIPFLKQALSLLESGEGRGVVMLDCWAGNAKIRAFYERAGWTLHGVFPQEDYEIAVFVWELSSDEDPSSEKRERTDQFVVS